jgi:hypothetical protein
MKTLAEIAEQLRIPASTVRFYAKNYREFLPARKLEGERWEKYEDLAVDVIRLIADETKTGKNRTEVRSLLNKRFSPVYDAETGEEKGVTATEGQQQQPNNNMALATTLQQVGMVSREQAELVNQAFMTIQRQKELIQIKEEEVKALEGKLEAERIVHAEELSKLRLKREKKSVPANPTKKTKTEPKKKGFFDRLLG